MIDLNLIREDIDLVVRKLKSRGFDFDLKLFETLENKRKTIQVHTQELQQKRNEISKQIGLLKSKGEDASNLLEQVSKISDDSKKFESQLNKIQDEISSYLLSIPNLPHDSTPIGNSELENVVVRTWGDLPNFDFTVKDHVDLASHGLDFDLGAKLSGSRFVLMKGEIAQLHRAIGQFMLDIQTSEHGYEECCTPYLVNDQSLLGTGQLPKFEQDLFMTKKNDDERLYLIPTSEVPLTNIVRDEIISQNLLPLKFTAYTPCFRSEAGSYGKDTRGMIRQHQFDKVEMVQIVEPEKSYDALEEMVLHAENILKKLELPYQVVSLCTGDIGFSAAKTYDLEVWIPSQNKYREISSVSNCEDFQARRLKARYKSAEGKNILLHTLNGSGLAVGRTLVAILENYQQKDGSIKVPKALQNYLDGKELLTQI
ncbi:MAG: serine--tRNA ligase [Nitrosomonadales bacterium]